MNGRAIRAIVRKDISAITASTQMWLPMVIVSGLFVVVFPAAMMIVGMNVHFEQDADTMRLIQTFLGGIPDSAVKAQIAGFGTVGQQLVYLMLNYMLAPLFLIVPTMVTSLVAASSFVGEKEKKTLETLLFSPVREADLFTAKALSAFIPSMAISVGGFLLFALEFTLLGIPLFGRVVLPAPHWLPVVLWLSPALTLLVTFLNVLVSVKVKGFQEAQQVSVIVILPLIFLIYGQIGGIVFMGTALVMLVGLGVFGIDAFLIRAAAKTYNRDKLFGTQVF
jgi:ABC-2 type transport system permease protein